MKSTFNAGGLRLLGATVVALALTGGVGAQSAPAIDSGKTLRIAFQKGSIGLSVLKQRRTLEKRLPGFAVTGIEFPAGPQLLEALALGSADIGSVGDTRPIFSQAAGKDHVYVGAEPPRPDSSAVLVLKSSAIRTLADLKGKKIAFRRNARTVANHNPRQWKAAAVDNYYLTQTPPPTSGLF